MKFENKKITKRPDYKTEIVNLIRGDFKSETVRERLAAYHENDVALALETLNRAERNRLFDILDSDTLSGVLEYSENRNQYLSELDIKRQIEILEKFETSSALEYLESVTPQQRDLIGSLIKKDIKQEILMFDSFNEDEIGSKMTTNFISVYEGSSVKGAMKSLVEQAAENDNVSTIYVTDKNGVFVGAIDLKDLIIARENTKLSEITVTSYPYLYVHENVDECIERIKDYSEDSIPVLDANGRLKGVLTSQDTTLLIDDVMGEDYAKFAALSEEEDLTEPIKRSIKKRLPWLIVLLGLGLVVSSVVGAFENVVARLAIIVSFQSLILDMAGNSGTQSLAVTIRILTDEQLSRSQKLYLIRKESKIGLLNGGFLATISFFTVFAYLVFIKSQAKLFAVSVAACVSVALLLSIMLSSVIGTVVPLLFKKIKIDPAVASGPLITTLNDLIAVVAYYGLAYLLLICFLRF